MGDQRVENACFLLPPKDTVSSAFWSLSGSLAGMTLHESDFCLC